MSTEVDAGLVALVIALVALLVALAQLAAQVFATAEGTRQCSYAVLGEWSLSEDPKTKTIYRRRWREARLETIFTSPEIILSYGFPAVPSLGNEEVVTAKDPEEIECMDRDDSPEAILGANSALDGLLYRTAYEKYSPDRVGWISFLAFLRLQIESHALKGPSPLGAISHSETSKSHFRVSRAQWSKRAYVPKIKYIQHSWDFMPPDAPKPLASSTVGDIAVIVRRCGMKWTVFKPEEGIMMAEGGAHTIASMNLRLGIVLRYRCLDNSLRGNVRKLKKSKSSEQEGRFNQMFEHLTMGQVPLWRQDKRDRAINLEEGVEVKGEDKASDDRAKYTDSPNWSTRCWNWVNEDKMMFGLVPGDPALDIPDFPHATDEECWDTVAKLSGDTEVRKHLSQVAWCGRYEFNDLLLMAPECLRQRGMTRFPYVAVGYPACVFYFTEWAFTELLTRYLNGQTLSDDVKTRSDGGSDQMKHVLQVMQELATMDLDHIPDLEKLHDYHVETTHYFGEKRKSGLSFHALLKAHFNKAPRFAYQARIECNPSKGQSPCYGSLPISSSHNWRNRNMELYFLNIPDCIEVTKRNGCDNEELVIEAWLTLMLRAFLFMKLCDFSSELWDGYLPHKYYGSRIPVWLE